MWHTDTAKTVSHGYQRYCRNCKISSRAKIDTAEIVTSVPGLKLIPQAYLQNLAKILNVFTVNKPSFLFQLKLQRGSAAKMITCQCDNLLDIVQKAFE
jgi:hypothetical protein